MIEKLIEGRVCDYGKTKGVLNYKFTSPNRVSVPDRLFISPVGKVWFCEFKRTGAKPTPAQRREHLRIMATGISVYVIDSVECGKRMIDKELALSGSSLPELSLSELSAVSL